MEKLRKKIESKRALVGVVGLGYVGLPLAVAFAKVGFRITGIDRSKSKVTTINTGKSDVEDVASSIVAALVGSKNLTATNTYAAIQKLDVVVICVPTPLSKTKDPDVSYILSAVNGIKKHLRPGHLIILESTTYPGTTEELILPILETTGLKVGQDFFLAFSPERIDPGNKTYGVKNTPKVVGGITDKCTQMAKLFYEQTVSEVIDVSSSQSAEVVKLVENTFRSVNIGMVNEVALMCDRLGIDVWEVIDAAATKPFGYMPFYPGPGLGGHCIPIDPHYLSWKLRTLNYRARFIELAGDINANMPDYVIRKVNDALNLHHKSINGSRILILGVAYKRDISDVRESPALDVIKLLQEKGAQIQYNDPRVPKISLDKGSMSSVELDVKLLNQMDCVVIITDHSDYDYQWIADNVQCAVDTRNATKGVVSSKGKIVKL
ncbi:MAG: UDP-N-acetyl-D-glucosamine dehydrogenase [candidate division Zixibacteria bacterium SM23_81]|nr:MAG: UDP-N-acetyl-D-glucosamine dehydrogenase [candidate division Zixibacteria bacterium SM23_81]